MVKRDKPAVRLASERDAAAVRALVHEAYQPYVSRLGREPAPMAVDYVVAVAAEQVWVAERSDGLVGVLVVQLGPDHLLLENVAVASRARGQGIGGILLRRAEEQARRHGRGEVRLYTNEAMVENLSYYPRRGYRRTHTGVEDGFRRVYFTKRL